MDRILQALCALIFAGFATAVTGDCYRPNGTVVPDLFICDSNAEFSACCAPGDMCLTNGLCRAANSSGNTNDYWRESCTDPSWESDACPKYCYNSTTSSTAADGDFFIEACSTSTYCCSDVYYWSLGERRFECCKDPLSVFDAGPGIRLSGSRVTTAMFPTSATPTPTSSSGSSGGASTAATTSAGSASASESAGSDPARSGLSSGAKIGLGVGLAIGAVLIAAAVFTFFCIRRRRRQATSPSGPAPPTWNSAYPYEAKHGTPLLDQYYQRQSTQAPMQEMASNSVVYEAPTKSPRPVELGDGQPPLLRSVK